MYAGDDKSPRYFSEAKFPPFFSPEKWEIRDQDLLPAGVFTGDQTKFNLHFRLEEICTKKSACRFFLYLTFFFERFSVKSCAWHPKNQFTIKNIHCFLQVSVGGWRLVIIHPLLVRRFFFPFSKVGKLVINMVGDRTVRSIVIFFSVWSYFS